MKIVYKLQKIHTFMDKRLYYDIFHEWKLTPFHLINQSFDSSFKFHLNLSIYPLDGQR